MMNVGAAMAPVDRSGRYVAELRELATMNASGVYAIVERGRVLYVGESHSGRLFDTLTRHFRSWRVDPRQDAKGRRFGGTTYDRRRVRVAWLVTERDTAQTIQYAEIDRLKPRDNSIDGAGTDEIPV